MYLFKNQIKIESLFKVEIRSIVLNKREFGTLRCQNLKKFQTMMLHIIWDERNQHLVFH